MAKTSRDARRHIRELSDLFYGFETVGYAVVEDLLAKSKRRKYLKQSLRRLVSNSFLTDDGNAFTPTVKGYILFSRFCRRNNVSPPKIESWDKKWRLVVFDVPSKFDIKRNRIRSFLKGFGFCQLQKSVWICPDSISQNFWKMIVKENLDEYCKTMVVSVLEGDKELRSHFHIRSD